jgi:hypothetical protein
MKETVVYVVKEIRIDTRKVGKKYRSQVYDSGILMRVSWRRTEKEAEDATVDWVHKNYEVPNE